MPQHSPEPYWRPLLRAIGKTVAVAVIVVTLFFAAFVLIYTVLTEMR